VSTVARADRGARSVGWRAIAAGPAVALVTVVVALITTGDVDVPFRDPDHVAATYFVLVGLGVALLVSLDVALRAMREEGAGFPPSRAAMGRVHRERWTPARAVVAGSALLGFYVTYMAYRNLKAVVPLVRPDVLFDGQLADWDRAILGGHDPAPLLHSLLGTGVATQVRLLRTAQARRPPSASTIASRCRSLSRVGRRPHHRRRCRRQRLRLQGRPLPPLMRVRPTPEPLSPRRRQ